MSRWGLEQSLFKGNAWRNGCSACRKLGLAQSFTMMCMLVSAKASRRQEAAIGSSFTTYRAQHSQLAVLR